MREDIETTPTIGRWRGLWWWWWWVDHHGLPVLARGPFATRAEAVADIEAHDNQ